MRYSLESDFQGFMNYDTDLSDEQWYLPSRLCREGSLQRLRRTIVAPPLDRMLPKHLFEARFYHTCVSQQCLINLVSHE
ncbi:hypothetical protein Mal52_05220 [Symmachiella dynata]|uniref:Uncharacterized protein n=1 Tax=Symmachiella dynata TaxID=2527995 RepID=A0A517ZHV7_9PLAN|nr:hypothetical protein Mal52_05220 [Symmachiella dynata]